MVIARSDCVAIRQQQWSVFAQCPEDGCEFVTVHWQNDFRAPAEDNAIRELQRHMATAHPVEE
jgi:hypothetical protein